MIRVQVTSQIQVKHESISFSCVHVLLVVALSVQKIMITISLAAFLLSGRFSKLFKTIPYKGNLSAGIVERS